MNGIHEKCQKRGPRVKPLAQAIQKAADNTAVILPLDIKELKWLLTEFYHRSAAVLDFLDKNDIGIQRVEIWVVIDPETIEYRYPNYFYYESETAAQEAVQALGVPAERLVFYPQYDRGIEYKERTAPGTGRRLSDLLSWADIRRAVNRLGDYQDACLRAWVSARFKPREDWPEIDDKAKFDAVSELGKILLNSLDAIAWGENYKR